MGIGNILSELYFSLGQRSMGKNKAEEALCYLNKAHKYSPNYFQIDCHMALYLSAMGKYTEAEKIILHLLEKHAPNAIIYYYAGLCSLESKKFADAEQYFTSALTAAPKNNVMKSYLGLSLLKQGKRKEAFKQIRGSGGIGSEPGGELMYIFEKEIFEAEKACKPEYRSDIWGSYTKQIQTNSYPRTLGKSFILLESIITRCFLSCSFLGKEKKEERKKLNMGFEKMALKRFDEAINIFEELMESESNEASVPEALFYSYLAGKEFEKAKKTFDFWVTEKLHVKEPVVENIGGDSELAINAGKLYFAFRDYKTSLQWFRKAVSIDPKEFISHYYTGACLVALGEREEATMSFKKTLEQLNPNFLLSRFKTWHRSTLAQHKL